MADRRILAYITRSAFLFKSRHTAEQIEEVVGGERAVQIQSRTTRSFIWKDKDVLR